MRGPVPHQRASSARMSTVLTHSQVQKWKNRPRSRIACFSSGWMGDRRSHLVILEQGGDQVEQARLPTTQASPARRFSGIPACQVAIEVGAHSRWVSALLTRLGHEVLVADARKLRLIYNNPRKHDRGDAEYLARPLPRRPLPHQLSSLDPGSNPGYASFGVSATGPARPETPAEIGGTHPT